MNARPSREGVRINPTGTVTVPAKPSRMSKRDYRATYDSDPIVIWSRHPRGTVARYRAAGPLSARGLISGLRGRHVVAWEADASSAPPEGL